jgi:hypothetical protein
VDVPCLLDAALGDLPQSPEAHRLLPVPYTIYQIFSQNATQYFTTTYCLLTYTVIADLNSGLLLTQHLIAMQPPIITGALLAIAILTTVITAAPADLPTHNNTTIPDSDIDSDIAFNLPNISTLTISTLQSKTYEEILREIHRMQDRENSLQSQLDACQAQKVNPQPCNCHPPPPPPTPPKPAPPSPPPTDTTALHAENARRTLLAALFTYDEFSSALNEKLNELRIDELALSIKDRYIQIRDQLTNAWRQLEGCEKVRKEENENGEEDEDGDGDGDRKGFGTKKGKRPCWGWGKGWCPTWKW